MTEPRPEREPLYDPEEVKAAIRRATNSNEVVPLLEGNWKESPRDYETEDQAACGLIFDLSWWCDYRYSQIRQIALEAGLGQLFSKEEIDDIVDAAWEKQGGTVTPTRSEYPRLTSLAGGRNFHTDVN